MKRGVKESISAWREKEKQEPSFLPLRENTKTDVCVIGAGIAGLTTAYLLQKEGKSVIVVDAWGLAAGETSRTTAHLTAVLDDRFFKLEELFGKEKTRLAAESHMAAINRIEEIVRDEQIDCDFERLDGYLTALDDKQKQDFVKEIDAARRAGFADMRIAPKVAVPGIAIGEAMLFPQQATFHIMNYILGLTDAFKKLGGRIYTGSHVNEIQGGKEAYVKTDDGFKVSASHIVVATNTPINDWVKMHTKQAAYRTYVVAFEVPKNSYRGFLLWDMEDPYHYVRIMRGEAEDLLLVGGEDHKTGQANDMAERYRRLEEWTKPYFSHLGPVKFRWSGQVLEPVDSLAFIGRNPGDEHNVYIATGDSGNGMTHGTIAGILITDLILERENPWKEVYEPSRKSLRSVGTYIDENVNVVGSMLKKWVAPSELNSVAAIPPGHGAIMRDGASKTAVYRDERGEVHSCSAICTHLGCIVQWNEGEKSWDCPCHGSRFDTEGKILNGPAIKRLESVAVSRKG